MSGKRAFSYMRFSRKEQGRGDSIRRQTALRDAHVTRYELILDDELHDRGVSAYRGKNAMVGRLADFLENVKAGRVPRGSVLLIESIDRFSRDEVTKARDLFETILRAGVEIHTLSPERIYNEASLTDSYALIGMVLDFARAHEYSQQIGSRLAASWSEKREKAKLGKPMTRSAPAWLRIVEGKWEVIPERGEAVRLIFRLCADGMGINLIRGELERRGVPAFGRSGEWTVPYIAKILSSESVIGTLQPFRGTDPTTRRRIREVPIENHYPAVVDHDLFVRAKVAMRGRRNKGGRVVLDSPVNLFTGLLVNPKGRAIHVKYRKTGRKNARTFAILRDQKSGLTYPLEAFEGLFMNWITGVPVDSLTGTDDTSELGKLRAERDRLTFQIQTLTDRIGSAGGDQFTSFLDLLSKAERDRKSIVERIETLETQTPLAQGMTDLGSAWRLLQSASDDEAKRELRHKLRGLLRRVVKKIVVDIGNEHRFWNHKSLGITAHYEGWKESVVFDPNETGSNAHNGVKVVATKNGLAAFPDPD